MKTMITLTMPFSPTLWVRVLGISIISAWVFWYLEKNNNTRLLNSSNMQSSMIKSWYLTCAQAVGGETHTPKTPMGKCYQIFVGMFFVVLISAYTANLATFLMTKAQGEVAVSGLAQLKAEQLPICFMRTPAITFNTIYPGYKVKTIGSFADLLKEATMDPGVTCKASATDASTLAMWRTKSENCNLRVIGKPLWNKQNQALSAYFVPLT